MARKKIIKELEIPTTIEDIEEISISKSKMPKAKKVVKLSSVKVKPMPEVYVEDTFDPDTPNTEQIIIENKTKVKVKKIVSRDELINSEQFKLKLKKITARIEFDKSFDFLWDYVHSTKLLKTVYINDEIDEYDVILEEVTLFFKKRLRRINLTLEIYELINNYFESLKTLYGRFKRMELAENDTLVAELEKMKSMSDLIKYYIF